MNVAHRQRNRSRELATTAELAAHQAREAQHLADQLLDQVQRRLTECRALNRSVGGRRSNARPRAAAGAE